MTAIELEKTVAGQVIMPKVYCLESVVTFMAIRFANEYGPLLWAEKGYL